MGGITVTTETEIPARNGHGYSVGKAKDQYGNVIEIVNFHFQPVPSGKRCVVMHAAGGQYHINSVEC
jgi:hypothetical protein